MPEFSIIQGKRHHCGAIIRRLRHEQSAAFVKMGIHCHRQLTQSFGNSSWCKAWLIDGHIHGLGGVEGPLMAATGNIWLALSQQSCQYPVAMTKAARTQLREIMQIKKRLVTTIFENDAASMRFAQHLGFEPFADPVEINGAIMIPVMLGNAE
jgi:hypothetical protein